MGRGASSCLKIMTCGGGRGAEGEDAVPLPDEAKSSPQDKAKWNFLLRSSRNQVSSNIAVSGPLASVPEKDEESEASIRGCSPQPENAAGKVRMMKFAEFVPKLSFHLTEPEILDSIAVNEDTATEDSSDPPHQKSKSLEQLPVEDGRDDSNVTSKESDVEAPAAAELVCDAASETEGSAVKESVAVGNDAEVPLPSMHDSEASTPTHDTSYVDQSLVRESSAIKIQAAVRAYLAELALKKNKNVVKLQAVARGYLVRREAVSTLRCVQAILKMQALVRARRMNHNAGKLDRKGTLEALVQEAEGFDCLVKEASASVSNGLCLSNEKLLKNRFIIQLLESTPRSNRIYISCEPSRSDSAWKWLERWMTVIASDSMLHQEPNLGATHQAVPEELFQLHCSEEFVELNCSEESSQISAPVHLLEIPEPCDPEPNITVKEDSNAGIVLECHVATSTTLGLADEAENVVDDESVLDEASDTCRSSDIDGDRKIEVPSSGMGLEPTCERSEYEGECLNHTDEIVLNQCKSELPELHSAEFPAEQVEVKSINVEEATGLLVTSPPLEIEENEQISEIPIPLPLTEAENLDKEDAVSHEPITQVSSESDSEASVSSSSSSSASPDSSESESEEVACEKGNKELEECDPNKVSADFRNSGNENHEKDASSKALTVESLETVVENVGLSSHSIDDEHTKSSLSMEPTALNVQDEHEDGAHKDGDNQQAYSLSPERSSDHNIMDSSSYETPPSQIPIITENGNTEEDKATEKNGSSDLTCKRSLTSDTRTTSNAKPEQQPAADSKNAKRKLSIGTAAAKPDSCGPRSAGSNSNSLPSYMQATESARAKVHASISPKSSPDLKDSSRKKRLSLPAAAGTEKHNISPRMQRSGSQVHQAPKANGIHAPLNFSERRWQR